MSQDKTTQKPVSAPPTCPYCKRQATFLASSELLYHGQNHGPFWACLDCRAWVGCHRGTTQPLGHLANRELRAAKLLAHTAFDPIWKQDRIMPRKTAYAWLSKQLGIQMEDCHIGLFDMATCTRAIEICTEFREHEKRKMNIYWDGRVSPRFTGEMKLTAEQLAVVHSRLRLDRMKYDASQAGENAIRIPASVSTAAILSALVSG